MDDEMKLICDGQDMKPWFTAFTNGNMLNDSR
jgi:hypothetical protein